MSPALLAGDGMVERFKREARTAASLSHPNIIPIYAVKDGDQIVYFIMKFVEGRPLDSIIKETGKLPIPMAQQILQQVGAGLGYAPQARDHSPRREARERHAWTPRSWAVVTDFGIAKVTETKGLTVTGATVGTPSYMSPEQCAAKELTGASDQYTLGVVAYEMLAGKLPFQADSIMAIMYSHFNDPPPPLSDIRPDCPPEIVNAIMRMLAKEPGDRFPSVEDAISAIGVPVMAPDDPVRTQLMTLAASNKNTEMLKRLTTPVSMPGRTQTGKSTVSTTGGTELRHHVPQQVSVVAGGAVQLTAKLKGTGGRTLVGPRVTWASTAPELATTFITPQGLRWNATAEGEVLITCTCEGASATATITVTHAQGRRSKKGWFVGAGVLVAGGIALAVLQAALGAEVQCPAQRNAAAVGADTGHATEERFHAVRPSSTPPSTTPAQSKAAAPISAPSGSAGWSPRHDDAGHAQDGDPGSTRPPRSRSRRNPSLRRRSRRPRPQRRRHRSPCCPGTFSPSSRRMRAPSKRRAPDRMWAVSGAVRSGVELDHVFPVRIQDQVRVPGFQHPAGDRRRSLRDCPRTAAFRGAGEEPGSTPQLRCHLRPAERAWHIDTIK